MRNNSTPSCTTESDCLTESLHPIQCGVDDSRCSVALLEKEGQQAADQRARQEAPSDWGEDPI